MSKLRFVLSILALPLALHSIQAQPAEMKAGTATVSGRITLKGEPARDVAVALQAEDAIRAGDRIAGSRAKTDDNGRFRITGLKAGRYALTTLAPGFVAPSETAFGLQGKAINLAEGENLDDIEIALKRGGVITGRVTDANDKPLVDQRVELIRLDERGQPMRPTPILNVAMFSTDDRGVYRLYGLAEGRYLVSVGFAQREGAMMMQSNRTFYQRTFHPDTTDQSQAKIVEVSEGFEATGVNIKTGEMKKTYDLFGRVVNADTGQPAPGVRMSYGALTDGDKRFSGWGSFGNQTDAQGEFQIQGVLPGKYAVFAQRERDGDLYSEPVVFEISDGDVTGLVVKVRRGGSISGAIVIEGSNDPAVLAKLPQIDIYASVRSDDLSAPDSPSTRPRPDGSFMIRGLKSGVARLSIYIKPDLGRFSIIRIEHNGATQREGVAIGAGEQVTGVRVVIGQGTNVLRGQARITGGALPADASLFVQAYRAGTSITNGSGGPVDERGQFTIEGLMPGEYELKLTVYFRFGSSPEKSKLAERMAKLAQPVTVGGDQETRVVFNIDLTPKEGEQ
ncbi:MAG: MSCRAMM family protein [Blastocatellia bacterium]